MADGPEKQPDGAPPQDEPAGGVEIGDGVVAKIANTACRDIEGVNALGGATSRALAGLRGGEHRTQGVNVDLRGDVVDIDVTLVVDYGASIPQVAQACRERVRDRVESITGLKVKAVNVVVADVNFPEADAGADAPQS